MSNLGDEVSSLKKQVSDLKKSLLELQEKDLLTAVYNRIHFEHHFPEILEEHKKNKRPLALILLNLDNFKNINNQYGHAVGDQLLKDFVTRINSVIKNQHENHVVRLNADEFLVVLQSIKNADEAFTIAEHLLTQSQVPYAIESHMIHCVPSIGIATYPNTSSATLLQQVGFALLEAKNNKDHKIQNFTETLMEKFKRKMYLEELIKDAFATEKFYLVFQPQFDVEINKITGLEALLRLNHKEEEIPPSVFVPIIERMGLAEKLNEYVIAHLLKILTRHEDDVLCPTKISFNFSPHVTYFDQHVQKLLTIINAKKLNDCFQLELEITESAFIQTATTSFNQVKAAMVLLQKNHIQLAIDDFGTGYSSISRLMDFPIVNIKIDKIFIDRLLSQDKTAMIIIKSMIEMGRNLGFMLIAEGVETKEQVKIMISLGCHIFQSFYFYKPMLEADAFALISAQT